MEKWPGSWIQPENLRLFNYNYENQGNGKLKLC